MLTTASKNAVSSFSVNVDIKQPLQSTIAWLRAKWTLTDGDLYRSRARDSMVSATDGDLYRSRARDSMVSATEASSDLMDVIDKGRAASTDAGHRLWTLKIIDLIPMK